jgi:hypothetical protein
MQKEEYIEKYGEKAYNKMVVASTASARVWRAKNPEGVLRRSRQFSRKGGKYYKKRMLYNRTGLQGERNSVRNKHQKKYRTYKRIIAPWSRIHHERIPETAEYRGVALVEADQHMHGIVDVIEILEGEITIATEEEIRNGGSQF